MGVRTLLITTALSLAAMSTHAQDEAPAKAAICKACHGEKGAKPIMETYPKINGQNQAYLEAAMKAYQTGQRKGGMAAVMTAQAQALSDEEISALSEYYANQ